MQIPEKLLASLSGVPGFDKDDFIHAHESAKQITSIRINPAKPVDKLLLPPITEKVPLSSFGFYLRERPSFTFDPLFHAGCYYVQEASSMFLEQALRQSVDLNKPLRVLDLCAAPGGKSTLVQSLISPDSMLVSNEVIKQRVVTLEENMIKWGASNVLVTNNDPSHFARLENYFDVIVVDAPCSGSGLFRREPDAINEWSENNVQLCSQRQQRILADVWPALKQNGILVYSTCSYSAAEDEDILDWLAENLEAESLRLQTSDYPGIVETNANKSKGYGYRFFPDKIRGEGFFLAVLQKTTGGENARRQKIKNPMAVSLSGTEKAIVSPWLDQQTATALFKHNDQVHAVPPALLADIPLLQSCLYIKKAGVLVGQLAARELLPSHELALSTIVNKALPAVTLSKAESIAYLQKEDIQLPTATKGRALAQYVGQNLGWLKILPNRVNNYYPKEWRIRKRVMGDEL